jgi:hypothetical protein
MSNPWQEHADNVADYQDMLKGDDNSGGATLTFTSLNPNVTVDCRYEKIVDDFDLIAGGQSPKLMIPACKFLADSIPVAQRALIRKGLQCVLLPNPTSAGIPALIWAGGLAQGGLAYEFVLVDRSYGA